MSDENASRVETVQTRCCIVGGGPAGMVLGFLLARAGVEVVVLEKHKDFLRDFRGDTIHPSTLEVMHELGLLEELLKQGRGHPNDEPGYEVPYTELVLAVGLSPAPLEATLGRLGECGSRALGDGKADWEQKAYPALVENALRQLIAVSPDLQTA